MSLSLAPSRAPAPVDVIGWGVPSPQNLTRERAGVADAQQG